MYTKAKYITMMMLLAASFTGCSTDEIYVAPESTLKVEGYITSEEASRTVYNDNGEMVSIAWAANDMVGLLPVDQDKHLQYKAKESSGTTEFTPVGEELKNIDGQKVYAYYPYNQKTTDYNHVVIPSNQVQRHNRLGGYDVMTATGVLSDNKLTLKFKHLYAFLKITLATDMLLPPKDDFSYSTIEVSAQNYPISILGNNTTVIYDFENDTIIAEKYRKYLNYNIDQKSLNQDKITCYIAILPIPGNEIISVSSTASWSDTKFICEKLTPSGGLKAGHVYELSVDKVGISEVMNLERDALIDFYNSTNGDKWTNNKNWCSDRPISEWYGLGSKGNGDRLYVTEISLENNNLTGTIPESIKNFSNLYEINLRENYLTGNIPESIVDIPYLHSLWLNKNCLSGTISDKILSHPNWKMYRDNLSIQRDGYGLEFPVYRSSDYSQDRKLTTLQTHTKGSGLKIFIVGEMYTDRDIADGTYLDHAKKGMEYFFEKEPYTTFRDYFDVYCINVVSSTDVFGKGTAFNTGIEYERGTFETYSAPVLDIVRSYPETPNKDYTVIVLMNTRCQGRSNCHLFNDGVSVAFNWVFSKTGIVGSVIGYYESFDHIIHHEVCGHGFGKLADEYVEFPGKHPNPSYLKKEHERNWSMNVDYINDPEKVCWSNFMTDPRYKSENIGIYEGALYYPKGVYRSTPVSIMGGSGPTMNAEMFNAPSRRSIYQRIMDLSGETYSFEKFLEYDEINRRVFDMGGASRSINSDPVDIHSITAPPMFYDYPSTEAGMH